MRKAPIRHNRPRGGAALIHRGRFTAPAHCCRVRRSLLKTNIKGQRPMEAIFVPITCNVCKRHSAVSVSKLEIKRKLETGEPIELRCAYDEVKWDATSMERLQIMKLSMENDAVDRMMSWPRRIDRQGAATI
jgi:hypothetical protein